MKTFNEAMVEVADNVKAIMKTLGFEIIDRGVPTVLRVEPAAWTVNGCAMYIAQQHTIYFRFDETNPLPDDQLEQVLAHEMVHAYQDCNMFNNAICDLTSNAYWEQKFERQAYTVQDLYRGLHLSGPMVCMQYKDIISTLDEERVLDIMDQIVEHSRKNALIV